MEMIKKFEDTLSLATSGRISLSHEDATLMMKEIKDMQKTINANNFDKQLSAFDIVRKEFFGEKL